MEQGAFSIYIAYSLKLLVSGAHLLNCSETLPAGLGAPITFVLHSAARLNSLKHHSDLPQLLHGTGRGTLSLGCLSPACCFGISPTGPDLNESGDSHKDALPTSPHTAGRFYEPPGPEHIFITFFYTFLLDSELLETEMDDVVIWVFLASSKCSIKAC